ncbi:MAG: sugar phosphate isomerase/epimerase [Chloroflexi bacterium]|nr:sugar phosphate isomerase/epimerase [Chloroflexota bacterium]
MKVGLDTISFNPLNLDPMGFLDITVEYGLEGLQLLGTRTFIDKPAEYSDHFLSKLRAHNLYLELYGARINPKDSGKTVDDLVQDWIPLFPAAARMGATCLNTSFGLLKERTMTKPTFAEQYELATQVLQKLAPIAADYNVAVTVELHVDLTSSELARMIERVNSPWVGVNMDTANPLGMLEDPVEATEILAPYAKTTHYKDTVVISTDKGYTWLAGTALGTGQVDLRKVTEILYKHNPNINLNIEDGWGFIEIPAYDEKFLSTLDYDAAKMMKFMKHLRLGEKIMAAGIQPRPEDYKNYDAAEMMKTHMRHSVEYAKKLRDEIVAQAAAPA